MPLVSKSLTIPANTPIANPVSVDLACSLPQINRGWILFPEGCSGLVGARVFVRGYQVAPRNSDGFIVEDRNTVEWSEDHVMQSPYIITLVAYNLDDTFSHTVYFRADLGGVQ